MAVSQTERVYEAIKKDILHCELPPGAVVVQSRLAAHYHSGITPLREALQRLALEGLTRPIPRHGYLVTPISLADVQELFDIREVLEVAAACRAAQRASEAEVCALRELAEPTYIFLDRVSYGDFLTHNKQFHLTIAAASGNRRMVEIIEFIHDSMSRVFFLSLDVRDSAEAIREEHRQLAAAIAAGDSDACERIVKEQVNHTRRRVLEALVSAPGPGGSKSLGLAVQIRAQQSGSPPYQKGVSAWSNQSVQVISSGGKDT